MGFKDWFGLGGKKYPRGYEYPYGREEGDIYYPEHCSWPQSQNLPPAAQYSVGTNRVQPLSYSELTFPKSTSEEMAIGRVLQFLYPQTKDATDFSAPNNETQKNNTTSNIGDNASHSETPTTQNDVSMQKNNRPALAKPRKLIILLIENTHNLGKWKANILQLISGIADCQKDALFLLLELGKTNHFFELADSEDFSSKNMLQQLLDDDNSLEGPNLPLAFTHINKYLKEKTWPRFEFKDVAYKIDSCDIICIGNRVTVDSAMSNIIVSKSLTEISQRTDVNLFKYLSLNPFRAITAEDSVRVISLNIPKPKAGFFQPFKPQTKDIIVLLVENTPSILARKDTFASLLNQIMANQKNALYLLVKVGTTNKYTPLLDYEEVTKNKLILDLFDTEISAEQTKFAEALEQVKNTLVPILINKFSFNKLDYESSSFSFVCIGSGSARIDKNSKTTIATCIKAFTSWKKTKNLKYLCVSDQETIKAASLGFPDIKHIVSDFYN